MVQAATSGVDFDATVTEFAGRLRAFIRRRVPDGATADDLTQETLLKVFRSRASLPDAQRLEAWLYRIARNTLIDYYRRRRPTAELPPSLAEEPADGPDELRTAVLRTMQRFLA